MNLSRRKKEFIFKDDRPFNSCHASTLVLLPEGEILAAWFGGSEEGAEDVAIWTARRSEGKWSEPVKTADKEGIPHWNPVLFKDNSDQIYLFYKIGYKIPEWRTMIMKSDDGYSWSEPEPLVKGDRGGRGPVRNKPIILQNGTWLAPASIETEDSWDAFVDISRDRGQTWEKSQMVPKEAGSKFTENENINTDIPVTDQSFQGKGVIQPTLWESNPGQVHMLLRSTEGCIYRSDSEDGGKTWCPAYPTELSNNNSGIDLTKLDDGTLVLAYNPVGENWGPRTPLVLSVSVDNGETWKKLYIMEDNEGEYSYPAIISNKNEIYVTYTWKRERIAFWKIERGAINNGKNR
ncbi:MAG: sialidase family protein [Bacillota bacterium]